MAKTAFLMSFCPMTEYEMAKVKAASIASKPKDMSDGELKKEMGDESRRYIMAFRGYDSLRSAMKNLSDTLYLQRYKYHEWSDIQMRHADLELELMERRLEVMRKKREYTGRPQRNGREDCLAMERA